MDSYILAPIQGSMAKLALDTKACRLSANHWRSALMGHAPSAPSTSKRPYRNSPWRRKSTTTYHTRANIEVNTITAVFHVFTASLLRPQAAIKSLKPGKK